MMRTLIFGINGENVSVTMSIEGTLAGARDKALVYSANTGRPVLDWDIYDDEGTILPPDKLIGDGVPDRMFLALRMASICHTVGYQDCPGHEYDVLQAKGYTVQPHECAPHHDALVAALAENKELHEQLVVVKNRLRETRAALLECAGLLHALPSREMGMAREWIEEIAGAPIT